MVKFPRLEMTQALVDHGSIAKGQVVKLPYKCLCLYKRLVLLSALTKKLLSAVCND